MTYKPHRIIATIILIIIEIALISWCVIQLKIPEPKKEPPKVIEPIMSGKVIAIDYKPVYKVEGDSGYYDRQYNVTFETKKGNESIIVNDIPLISSDNNDYYKKPNDGVRSYNMTDKGIAASIDGIVKAKNKQTLYVIPDRSNKKNVLTSTPKFEITDDDYSNSLFSTKWSPSAKHTFNLFRTIIATTIASLINIFAIAKVWHPEKEED